MNDLPELPFEKVLSYLSLEDRLKSMAVSRRWYHKINSFKAKSLCYSERTSGFIRGKSRWISGAFAQNFISSTRFASFFNTFGRTILSNLKHLRLCDLYLNLEQATAFAPTLNSFGQLEKLNIIRFNLRDLNDLPAESVTEFELNLPMLNSIHLESLSEFDDWKGNVKLILDAPRLQEIKLSTCESCLDLVHAESVEKFSPFRMDYNQVKKMKNLKFLYADNCSGYDDEFGSTILSDLEQLKEIHLRYSKNVSKLFELKHLHGRTDLKIFFCGFLLNGPDPAINSFSGYRNEEFFFRLSRKRSRLADEIPFNYSLHYSGIESVAPGSEVHIFSRFSDLNEITVDERVEDIERFLDFLKNFGTIVGLDFWCDQPQELFDRLPEHCAVQRLTIHNAPLGFGFLSRLNHLVELDVRCSIDIELIRKVFEELPFLSRFKFEHNDQPVVIEIHSRNEFSVWVRTPWNMLPDLNSTIQFIIENTPQQK